MKKKPSVAKAIDTIRAEGRKLAVYDLARAMAEAEEVIIFAKANKNATAYFKAVEHRAKLRTRVFTVVTVVPKPSAVLTAVPGPAIRLSADGAKAWVPFRGD